MLTGVRGFASEEVEQSVKALGLQNAVEIRGWLPREELYDAYRRARAFVYPSTFEGFGMPPVEAMACGCPVISSTRGALGEVVGDAAALVDPDDTGSLQQQMTRLAADVALCEGMRQEVFERARRFDWRRAAEATLEVYAQAVAERSKARTIRIVMTTMNPPGRG